MDDIRDFIIEVADFTIAVESHCLEEDHLTFTALFTKPGETHRLEVTIRELLEAKDAVPSGGCASACCPVTTQ